MSEKHTLERLTVRIKYRNGSSTYWIPGLCTNIATEDEARRVVACLRVCQGISIEMLEAMPKGPASMMPMYTKLADQCGELLAALKRIAAEAEEHKIHRIAKSAIATWERG